MFSWETALTQRGLAAATAAPMNVEQEQDSPPGAPDYANGPLANMPRPTPTPAPPSLTTLAAGGYNHQEAWMSGQAAPQRSVEQQPFNSSVDDTPPGAPPYVDGPLAIMPPRPTPAPKINMDLLKRFSWSGT